MVLEIKLGATVSGTIDGHSAVNGAVIGDTATVTLTSNTATVATVDPTVPVPAGGAATLTFPVTVVGVGSTDIHCVVTTADGQTFEDTATLIVDPAPTPGLVRVQLTLTSP